MSSFLKKLEESIMHHYAFPTLVKVSHATASPKGYTIDGEGILPGSYKSTGELFKEIPVSPLWADQDGRGVFVPIATGQMVVVNFIGGNKAFPYVSAIYGEEYKPFDSANDGTLTILDAEECKLELNGKGEVKAKFKDKFFITINKDGKCEFKDDKSARFKIEENLLEIGNANATVKTLLESILDLLKNFSMTGTGNNGAPVLSSPTPDVPEKITQIKTKIEEVFKA